MAVWLVRPREAAAVLDCRAYQGVRLVSTWRRTDPHRGLFATMAFGMKRAAPHVIHAEEEPDSLAALHVAVARRLAAPKARLVLHTWQNVNRPKRWPVRAVLRVTLGAADAVLCASTAAVGVLRAEGFVRPASVILPIGVDLDTYGPRPADRLSPGFTVGFAGRLAPEKGLDTLLRAVARLDGSTVLALAGTGPSKAALEAQAEREGLGDRVRFLGRLDANQVATFLCAIDVLVLPSRATPVWKEQFGRVLAEGMACGVPVVGSRSGEIPNVIGDAGLLFPQDDADALRARLGELRDSPDLRLACTRLGLDRALRLFSASRLAQQTAAFYRELVETSPGVAR